LNVLFDFVLDRLRVDLHDAHIAGLPYPHLDIDCYPQNTVIESVFKSLEFHGFLCLLSDVECMSPMLNFRCLLLRVRFAELEDVAVAVWIENERHRAGLDRQTTARCFNEEGSIIVGLVVLLLLVIFLTEDQGEV